MTSAQHLATIALVFDVLSAHILYDTFNVRHVMLSDSLIHH